MFRYLFKIYKLRQLVRLRQWHIDWQETRRRQFLNAKDAGNTELEDGAWQSFQFHKAEAAKLENRIKLYE